jgi:hypothetical protein
MLLDAFQMAFVETLLVKELWVDNLRGVRSSKDYLVALTRLVEGCLGGKSWKVHFVYLLSSLFTSPIILRDILGSNHAPVLADIKTKGVDIDVAFATIPLRLALSPRS